MYSFANRKDTTVVDEPHYAYYLNLTQKQHPGFEETTKSQSINNESVINDLLNKDFNHEIVLFKNMAHHLIEMNTDFLEQLDNVFLIRNPKQLIASFAQVIEAPEMEDVGSKRQWELFEELTSKGLHPIVLDSNEVLKNPAKVLGELCNKLNIPFTEEMLKWEAGAIKEDGVWAKYWYANVHASTGFMKQKTSERELPEHLVPLYEECRPFYEKLYKHAIKA